MKKLKDVLKYATGVIIRAFWNVSGIFIHEKKNLIVFDSFVGKQYSCNPRAIYEYLIENTDDNLEYVWAFIDPEKYRFLENNKNTRVVKYHSLKHQYYFYRAGTIVFNWKKTYDLPSHKSQNIIETWHGGGCYKKSGTEIKENSGFHTKVMIKETNKITAYISSSRYFSENVIRKQQGYKGKIIETGMPRNDLLINNNRAKASEIRQRLGIGEDKFVILYAPTYRDSIIDQDFPELSYEDISKSAEKRFKKEVIFLYRGHHYSQNQDKRADVTDVSDYFDMQDLLLISDMLISDYSSSIWDYSFTYRPCYLYTPDLDKYIEGRGLDEDIYSWGFPVALTNDELVEKIENFDENDFIERMNNHHKKLGSFENGSATEQVCSYIINCIKEKK